MQRSLPLAAFALCAPVAVPVLACNRGSSATDAGAGVVTTATTVATATGVSPTETAPTAVPSGTTLQPLGTGGPRPLIKLPDGGFAPAPVPEGGAFALPTFTMPSGMPSTITIPSTIQVPSALPTAFPSAWPQPPK